MLPVKVLSLPFLADFHGGRNRWRPPGNQSGYALPTVMAVSLVITVLTMAMAQSVRQRIQLGIELKDRMTAYTRSYSAMNEVLGNILSSTLTFDGIEIHTEDDAAAQWNLYGNPIALGDDVSVRLRDLGGTVSPVFNTDFLRRLVAYRTKDEAAAAAFADTLADWQDQDYLKHLNGAERFEYSGAGTDDMPRDFYVQVPEELLLLKGVDTEVYNAIKDDITFWAIGVTNYLTMSEGLLHAVLGNDTLADRIVDLRKKGELTPAVFMKLTGIQPSMDNLYMPSGWIRVEVSSTVGKARDKIDAVIRKQESSSGPLVVAEWRR